MQVKATKRVKVVTGFRCNADCMFCYYKDKLKGPNIAAGTIKKDLDFAFRHGIREVDFSGGEPTIHPQLAELIRYAKAKGFRKVCIITNGIALANKGYYKNLVDAGLDETLFSLQGCDDANHDSFVNVQGSFKRMMAAIEFAASFGIKVRTNTVVHKKNYRDLVRICRLVVPFNPVQVNFIVVNDWQCAGKLFGNFVCSYTEMAPYLKDSCDFLSASLGNINVRYIPFCMMLGYEKYICDIMQLKYDPYEWLPWVRAMLEKHYRWYLTAGLIGFGLLTHQAPLKLLGMKGQDFLDECIINGIRRYGYRQGAQCRGCRYRLICDGLERTYAHLLGFKELKRAEGERIVEPYYFRTHLFNG
jgi:pyruvate-formate lyase-activating enzyme